MWASSVYPGNSHDAIIFQSTDLYNKILNENFLPAYCIQDSETEIYLVLLGDSAFHFLPMVDEAIWECHSNQGAGVEW